MGRITTSTVDPAGRVVATESPVQGLWTTVYDCLDRPKARINPLGCRTTSFAYDAAGRPTSETDPLGRIISFVFDGQRARRQPMDLRLAELAAVGEHSGR